MLGPACLSRLGHGAYGVFIEPAVNTGKAVYDAGGLLFIEDYEPLNPHIRGMLTGERTWYGGTFSLLVDASGTVPVAQGGRQVLRLGRSVVNRVPNALAPAKGVMRLRSTYQGGPYQAGRFGRGGTLWRTDPTYRSGQVRAERIVHDAGRRMGIDVRNLVDEIIYVPRAKAPFFVVQNGRRILALNERTVYGSDKSLRLLKAAHELGHAKVYNNPCLRNRLSYEAEEIYVESMARQALGSTLTPEAWRNSVMYENWYRQLLGRPLLPVP